MHSLGSSELQISLGHDAKSMTRYFLMITHIPRLYALSLQAIFLDFQCKCRCMLLTKHC